MLSYYTELLRHSSTLSSIYRKNFMRKQKRKKKGRLKKNLVHRVTCKTNISQFQRRLKPSCIIRINVLSHPYGSDVMLSN